MAWENKIPNFNFPSPEIKALRVGKGIFLSYLDAKANFYKVEFLEKQGIENMNDLSSRSSIVFSSLA